MLDVKGMKNLTTIFLLIVLSACSSNPTPFALGETVDAPTGYTLCKQDRPDECD